MDTIIIDPEVSGGSDFALLDSSSSVSVLPRNPETENADSTVILNDQLKGTINIQNMGTLCQKSAFPFFHRSSSMCSWRKFIQIFSKASRKTKPRSCPNVRHIYSGLNVSRNWIAISNLSNWAEWGFRLWRVERFPKIAQSFFKRLMEDIDSQLEESSTGEPLRGIVRKLFSTRRSYWRDMRQGSGKQLLFRRYVFGERQNPCLRWKIPYQYHPHKFKKSSLQKRRYPK